MLEISLTFSPECPYPEKQEPLHMTSYSFGVSYTPSLFEGTVIMIADIIPIHANSVILVHDYIHATSLK